MVRPDENTSATVAGRHEVEVADLLAAGVEHGEPVAGSQLDGHAALRGDAGPAVTGLVG